MNMCMHGHRAGPHSGYTIALRIIILCHASYFCVTFRLIVCVDSCPRALLIFPWAFPFSLDRSGDVDLIVPFTGTYNPHANTHTLGSRALTHYCPPLPSLFVHEVPCVIVVVLVS